MGEKTKYKVINDREFPNKQEYAESVVNKYLAAFGFIFPVNEEELDAFEEANNEHK
jgi:hypothetical protein